MQKIGTWIRWAIQQQAGGGLQAADLLHDQVDIEPSLEEGHSVNVY